MSERELDGKVAIVTGAAGGIGRVTSRALAAAGAKVVLADLPTTKLEEAAGDAAEVGEAVHHPVDIADEASVEELIGFTLDRFGRLDVVDNNAALQAVAEDALITDMDVEVWDSHFDVNARGTMLMCKHAVPPMIEGGGGSIINIGSGTTTGGDDFATAYACTKAAIQTLTLYVATQYGHRGIRCNAIKPGLIRTPTVEATLPEPMLQVFVDQKLLGRLGEPQEIADLVLFLASDRSSYITGQVISADGGLFAHLPSVDAERRLVQAMSANESVG